MDSPHCRLAACFACVASWIVLNHPSLGDGLLWHRLEETGAEVHNALLRALRVLRANPADLQASPQDGNQLAEHMVWRRKHLLQKMSEERR